MKCPNCDGKGYVYNALGSFNEDCGRCQGTGKVRVEGEPMTNEEWIKSMNTERLAKRLHDNDVYVYFACKNGVKVPSVEGYVEWLKQPHKE